MGFGFWNLDRWEMAGKGGKGLLAAKTTAANKDKEKEKDKKRPVSKSSRAGIQVAKHPPTSFLFYFIFYNFYMQSLYINFLNLKFSMTWQYIVCYLKLLIIHKNLSVFVKRVGELSCVF